MQHKMLLCSWKRFYASLDRFVGQEILLCYWKRFYVSLEKSTQHEMLLNSWKHCYASLDESVPKAMLLWDNSVGRNSILNFPAKIWTRMCRAPLFGDTQICTKLRFQQTFCVRETGASENGGEAGNFCEFQWKILILIGHHCTCFPPLDTNNNSTITHQEPGIISETLY